MSGSLQKNLILLLLGLAVGLGIGFVGLVFIDEFFPVRAEQSALLNPAAVPVMGSPAPDFSLTTTKGDLIQLSSLKGKPIVLNFWATWCKPCEYEMPLIQEIYKSHSSDIFIIGVNVSEEKEDVQDYLDEHELTFPVLLDLNQKVSNLYRVSGIPVSFFIDSEGIIQMIQVGTLSKTQLQRNLAQLGVDQ
jgi:peroxiredoxin